jgi:predicted SAM-dependent methyltransferase
MRLNVGCGQTPTEGWRNFDNSLSLRLAKLPLLALALHKTGALDDGQYNFIAFARAHHIEYGDATELPLADGSVEVLYSSHMMEHLDQAEAGMFLQEALRVLEPGGLLRLAVPDLRKHVAEYLATDDADAFVARTLLTQARARGLLQRLRGALVGARHHHWMYDGPSLQRLLLAHGFVNPEIMPAGQTKIAQPGALDLQERCSESVYVEAEKAR